MTQLGGSLTGSIGQFREGTSSFRNARNWGENATRGELKVAVNNRVIDMARDTSAFEPSTHGMYQSTVEPLTPESETSADELSQDVSQGSSLSHWRLKREPKKHIPPKKS